MGKPKEGPAIEAVIERTVRQHTASALYDLKAAVRPLASREDQYGDSQVYKLLTAALEATETAARAVERWRIRVAPQGNLFDGEG